MIDFCESFLMFLSCYIWFLFYCKSLLSREEEKLKAVDILAFRIKAKLANSRYSTLRELETRTVEPHDVGDYNFLYKLCVVIIVEAVRLIIRFTRNSIMYCCWV